MVMDKIVALRNGKAKYPKCDPGTKDTKWTTQYWELNNMANNEQIEETENSWRKREVTAYV